MEQIISFTVDVTEVLTNKWYFHCHRDMKMRDKLATDCLKQDE